MRWMDEETWPDAWAEVDEETERLGDVVETYINAVDERELGAVWWLDGMSRIGVSFTSRVAEHRGALENLVGSENVTVLAAKYSRAELAALMDQIYEALTQGAPLTDASLDEVAGRIEVGVPTLNDEARAYVHRRWPHPAVTVREGRSIVPC